MNIFVLVIGGILGLILLGNFLVKGEPKTYHVCWRCNLTHYFNKISVCQECFRKTIETSIPARLRTHDRTHDRTQKKYIKFHGLDA